MSQQRPPHQLSIFLEEYKEIGANLRRYGNMRFAQLTLFVAVSGGLLAAVFGKAPVCQFVKKWLLNFLACYSLAHFGPWRKARRKSGKVSTNARRNLKRNLRQINTHRQNPSRLFPQPVRCDSST